MMIPRIIKGATHCLAEMQSEYSKLYIRREVHIADGVDVALASAWEPTPDELYRLNRGASVILKVGGDVHPPVILEVSDDVEEIDVPSG